MLNSFYDKFIFTNSLQYTHNNFFLINLPFIMLPSDILSAIAQKEDRELNLQLYYSVKDAVKTAVKKDFQVDFGVQGERGLDFMQTFFSASGWGKIERTDLEPEKAHALVSVANSIVGCSCKNMKTPADTFMRGILAGIFSIYFKVDVDCVEVKCTALGSPQCDFVVKPRGEFKFENPLTRAQLRFE